MKQDILEKLKKIKLLILDVDGVLTEGSIIYDDRARELKVFNVKDGLGVFLLKQAGIKSVILSARSSKVVKRRAKDMHIVDVFAGYPKEQYLDRIMQKYKVGFDEVCFIGDDLIDIEVAKKVGLSVAVADACRELKGAADFITEHKGGQGAVREIVEMLLKAQGLWQWDKASS
ncbi:MAG: HAD-IIIA family hydrolase [Candidatus Omnitrophica bacterium]|nr:HAD-IIIA family hydrolase [Candidatus Omnitrophota bacterium]